MSSNTEALPYKLVLFVILFRSACGLNSAFGFTCIEGYCNKTLIQNNELQIQSLGECYLSCNKWASLWPKPTGQFSKGSTLTAIHPSKIFLNYKKNTAAGKLLIAAENIFHNDIALTMGNNPYPIGGTILKVDITIENPNVVQLNLDTPETYSLRITKSTFGTVQVTIEAPNYFGARHGLQTLTQLIIYDDLRDELKILDKIQITDGPAYPYRGILLDSARNFLTIESLKRTIRGMAATKLNRLHWHLSDSQSFPYVSKSHPGLSKLGAYSPSKTYRPKDVRDLIEYATVRGVRIVPEFDAPSHVGAGWQNTGFVTCYDWQPWQTYCVEPPCGQLDPTVDKLYDFLEELYGDIITDFQPDILHFGGDEVSFTCWNATERIVEWMANQSLQTTNNNFIRLVQYFQQNALERIYKKAGREIPVIVWQSQLTGSQHLTTSYDSENVIVQIWANANFPQNLQILESNFKVILSNFDGLYLDCGVGDWNTNGGVNWCSPFKSWQTIYGNTPVSIAGNRTNQVLGQEAALWTETADSASIDTKLWPRAASMAEVVWSEPSTDWKAAEVRFFVQNQRLRQLGLGSEATSPEWCLYQQETCRLDSYLNLN